MEMAVKTGVIRVAQWKTEKKLVRNDEGARKGTEKELW